MNEDFLKHVDSLLKEVSFTIEERALKGASLAAERIGKAGEEKIREFVETRGLNRTWKKEYTSERSGRRRDGSGSARVDSGMMRDAIASKIDRSGDLVSVAMGWFNPDSDEEYPIQYQEFGFELDITGEFIPGMNSLEDTLIFIQENIWSLIEPNEILQFGPATTRGGGEAPF